MLSLQSATQRIVAYVLGAVPEDAAAHGRPTDVALPARKQVLASSLGMTPRRSPERCAPWPTRG